MLLTQTITVDRSRAFHLVSIADAIERAIQLIVDILLMTMAHGGNWL